METAGTIALLAKKMSFAETKILVSVSSSLSQFIENNAWRNRLMIKIMQWCYPSADAILSKSEGMRKHYIERLSLPKEKVHVVPNPVITPEFYIKANERIDHPWFKAGQPPVILGVGRLDWTKDFPTLIRAFAELRKNMDVRLMILGEGTDRPKLEEMVRELDIKKDVLLPGFVKNPYKYMKKANVFVLSSQSEGFGLVLVEAMACGCPVVSTDCHGPIDILAHGKWGRIVPVKDYHAMALAIEKAIYDSPATGITRAKHFTIDRAADAFLHIINSLISE
jgi:glycosyltransferase involved in cell wall biosynthesis